MKVSIISFFLITIGIYVVAFYEYEHYSVKIGILQGKNNVVFTNDIVILGFDTNIKLFPSSFGSVRFLVSFPDSRYTFFLFEPSFFYVYEILKIDSFFKLQSFLDIGIQNQREFVSGTSNTNISSFEYYFFFMPFFRVSVSGVIFEKVDLSLTWFGGYPIVFLPNEKPIFGAPVGYPSVEIGMRGIIFDRLSFLYNPLYYILSMQNKF